MFIGHYAVGLAAKRFAPRSSLGALIAAPILLDLLWPIFLLLGWEQVSIVPNSNPFLRLRFDSYPISHGLVAVIGWATLYAALYFGVTRYLAGTIVIWAGVISHWLLDYVVHRAGFAALRAQPLVRARLMESSLVNDWGRSGDLCDRDLDLPARDAPKGQDRPRTPLWASSPCCY